MKKLVIAFGVCYAAFNVNAQILTSDPPFPTAEDEITIYYNTNSGNQGIPTSTVPVYAHTGVVSQEDEDNCVNNWQYVQGNWGTADPNVIMTPMGGGIHKIVITPNEYYNIPNGFDIGRLMFVFRNQNGSLEGKNADGSDIYFELYEPGFHAGILQPYQSILNADSGETIEIQAASSEPADLEILVNGTVVASANDATELSYDFNETTSGGYNIELVANNGSEEITEIVVINVDLQPTIQAAPAGTIDGINYINDTTVRLQLYAPNKDFVYVIGDFNDWQFNADYLMKRTPDGNTYWLDITGLDPNTEYRFQYSIDSEDMRVADIYSEMILDPWNDQWIPEETYPDLLPYPGCSTSQPVSVFKINQEEFAWTDQSFVRPPANRLVIYELHIRDFIGARNYQTLIDTLDYIDNLGISAVQLMPINEFEGNDSWGYNPSFYFAPDKAYGSKEDLQAFVNECHNRGIAVILDIALNHSFGQNPMVRMYFDPEAGEYGQPTAENPWFNQIETHPFNVGYDFNHESQRTRQFCKRVLEHWLNEYHIDGYRFDLSKGFTQNNTLGNIAAWNAYDQSRVNILTDYHNHIQATEPGAYTILEHLGDNSEEQVLAGNGMMLWGKMTTQYEQASMGYTEQSDLSWGVHTSRGWSSPRLISYAESHDEERVNYKNQNFGNSSGGYDVADLNTGFDRMELVHTFLIPLPGPKMIWQFGELGYDYSINHCPDGSINEDCRTSSKPIRWDYRDVAERYKIYKVVSALNHLKKTEPLFSTTDFDIDLAGLGKRIHLNSPTLNATIVGNFNVTTINMVPGFQHTGTWYDYFTGTSFTENNLGNAFSYQPGEYHIYFDQPMATPDTTVNVEEAMRLFGLDFMVYPNPSNGELTIGFDNKEPQLVHIELLDITGTLIERIESRNMGTGTQTVSYRANDVAPGTYFIRITGKSESITRPVIIQ
jgi:1,4-alpha-glucan branching enzyme